MSQSTLKSTTAGIDPDKFIFNRSPVQVKSSFGLTVAQDALEIHGNKERYQKYVAVENWTTAVGPFDIILGELCQMAKPFANDYRYAYLDFKVSKLKAGDCGCAHPEWHTDVVLDPFDGYKEETHIIFASGDYTTEFQQNEWYVKRNSVIHTDLKEHKLAAFHAQAIMQGGGEYFKVPKNCAAIYQRNNVHRGPVVREDTTRLVMRMTFTDRKLK